MIAKCEQCGSVHVELEYTVGSYAVVCSMCGMRGPFRVRARDAKAVWKKLQELLRFSKEEYYSA